MSAYMYLNQRTLRIYLIWDLLIILPSVYFILFNNNEILNHKFFELLFWPYSVATLSSLLAGYFLDGVNSDGEKVKKRLNNDLALGGFNGNTVKYKLTLASLILIVCSVFSISFWVYKMFF
jgi:hypothetical protein